MVVRTESKRKVLLAFSGGIDSSYCVGKLRSEGYTVEALILDMTGDQGFITEAKARAESLAVPYDIIDVSLDFNRKVIDYFSREYLAGRTPAPCTVCNPEIKWKYLHRIACERDFDHIATGHYFRKSERNGHIYVRRALDTSKDQSYYLWMLSQEILKMALTPMGDEIKQDIIRSSSSPPRESMGVCFLKNRDYRDFIRKKNPDHPACQPGKIILDSELCGTHEGTAFYTIGQKKGLGLPAGYSVAGIDACSNVLLAAKNDTLFARTLVLENHMIAPVGMKQSLSAVIRGYGVNPEGNCSVRREDGFLIVDLDHPAWAPAKGQPTVLYDNDMVVGGGFIRDYR